MQMDAIAGRGIEIVRKRAPFARGGQSVVQWVPLPAGHRYSMQTDAGY